MALSRSSQLYLKVRKVRNRAIIARKRLGNVDPTASEVWAITSAMNPHDRFVHSTHRDKHGALPAGASSPPAFAERPKIHEHDAGDDQR
jgi:hypothetical protein